MAGSITYCSGVSTIWVSAFVLWIRYKRRKKCWDASSSLTHHWRQQSAGYSDIRRNFSVRSHIAVVFPLGADRKFWREWLENRPTNAIEVFWALHIAHVHIHRPKFLEMKIRISRPVFPNTTAPVYRSQNLWLSLKPSTSFNRVRGTYQVPLLFDVYSLEFGIKWSSTFIL